MFCKCNKSTFKEKYPTLMEMPQKAGMRANNGWKIKW